MGETRIAPSSAHPARMNLEPYSAEIRLEKLTLGLDNIHYDVYLSPKFVEFARKYLLDLVRQFVNLPTGSGKDRKQQSFPEHGAFRKLLTEILQESLTRAKFQGSIETDVLHQLAILKYISQELSNQFSSILVECKEYIRSRGEHFEHSEQAHVLRSKISDAQAERKSVIRQAGETLFRVWGEIEEGPISKSRRALFGDDFHDIYEQLHSRFLFVDGGTDDYVLLEHYVLLGNFSSDPDRFDVFDSLLLDFIREFVVPDENAEELSRARKSHERMLEQARSLHSELARTEQEVDEASGRSSSNDDGFSRLFWRSSGGGGKPNREVTELKRRFASLEKQLEDLAPKIDAAKQRMDFLASECQNQLGDYLNQPANARRLFDAEMAIEGNEPSPETRAQLLDEWMHRLEERELLFHVLAGYEVRRLAPSYSPPIHLQQLKKALVSRDEFKRVEQTIEKFPARKTSMKMLEDSARAIRRRSQGETRATCLQFTEDFMRLRRDRRNYQHVAAWMERIHLVHSERSRELSRVNKSLYEFLHPDEGRPTEDPILNHTIIKADVRGSTGITKDLLARGMNPASHFSMNLHEPVKKMLERYGASTVFIEGDAIILAIYENESTQATCRAVARACVLSREIVVVSAAYNQRAKSADLPPLEIGVGVAFQDSAPSLWMDGDSKIMISKALNLSDRLSSCTKITKRLFRENQSPFNVFVLQPLMEDAAADEGEELLIRYNLNGIELNEEGFQKLSAEISLRPISGSFSLPWGKEKVQLYFGEVPLGASLEPIVIRKGFVRQLLAGGKVGAPGTRPYYEVCTDAKLLELARKKVSSAQ